MKAFLSSLPQIFRPKNETTFPSDRSKKLSPAESELANIAAVTDEVFYKFYRPPLMNFLRLFETEIDIYTRLFQSLRLRESVILPSGSDPHIVAERRDAWTYGVFLAALFVDANHWPELLQDRCPWGEDFTSKTGIANRHPLSGFCIALSLVPTAGLTWLWQDAELWTEWVGALLGESRGSGEILRIVHTAVGRKTSKPDQPESRDSSLPQPGMADINEDTIHELKANNENDRDENEIPERICNDPFLDWLKREITAGRIKVDETGLVYQTDAGLLLRSPEIFKRFADEIGEDWHRIQNRFLRRRFHCKRDEGSNIHRLDINGKQVSGILLSKKSVLQMLDL